MPNQKKFLDAAGVTHLVQLLDNYPDNNILGTVITSIQEVLDTKGTYSKPSGGIPASDIAAGVIPDSIMDLTNDSNFVSASFDDKNLILQTGGQGVNYAPIYTFIRYANVEPTQDSDISTTPGPWMGIYSGSSAIAPAHYTDYVWYKIKEDIDLSLELTNAAIGQFVKIKTIDANGKPTSWEPETMFYTLTVTCVTQDDIAVTGQTVTVRKDDKNGPVYATAAYEGQPVSFALPIGFHYYVSVSDTLAHHFNPTTATGIITNTNIANTLTYSDFHTIQTAADIKGALNNDIDLTDLVGEQITCSKNNSTLTWDVVDYDSTNKTVTLLLHNVFGSSNMVFEPAQNLMWCEDGLAAGDYYFKSSSTNYYFTLTTAIPAGGVLRATTSAFTTRSSQSATTNLESGTVSTTEITGAIDLGTTGSGLLNHMDRVNYGSNNFAESALFWWLNSDAEADAYRIPVTKFSRPYSYGIAGFLNGLDQEFLDSIDNTVWKCNTNNVYECPTELGGVTPGKQKAYTVTAKIGLASEKEIFGSYGGTNDGSTVFDLYNGATATDRIKYRGTSAQTWWVRSPHWSYAYYERAVRSSGSADYYYANYSYGVVPACRISKDIIEE